MHKYFDACFRCTTCVDVLFTRPSAACPQCGTALRRSDFRVQQFEDGLVEKEVDVRKKIVKMLVVRNSFFWGIGYHITILEI